MEFAEQERNDIPGVNDDDDEMETKCVRTCWPNTIYLFFLQQFAASIVVRLVWLALFCWLLVNLFYTSTTFILIQPNKKLNEP